MITAKILVRVLFALLIVILFAGYVIPPFLDRICYRGPRSDHFDGQRFFNPDRLASSAAEGRSRWTRFMLGLDRAPWPKRVPVVPSRPPERVAGEAMRATWIGHATVLVQTEGLNILTDPVWSDRASPVTFAGPKRVRAPGVRFEDLPKIDLVLLSHNHYDHMDMATLKRLWARDRPLIVTPLGNDTILKARGIDSVARDWGERVAVRPGIEVIVERVHHWGSRFGRDRNRALWSGFTVVLPGGNLFFAGDTGAGDMHWPQEAARHGPVRLALIPVGAFLPRDLMADSHMDPAEAVEVFRRLGAAQALGIHWGTFQLTDEAIDAPPANLADALAKAGIPADRFRTTEAGAAWEVASLQPASPSAAASSSPSTMPNRVESTSR